MRWCAEAVSIREVKMGYYPIVIDLTGKKCLIVGGGEVALRKVQALLDAGARVTVVSPDVDPRIESLDGAEIRRESYKNSDLTGYTLVFAATDDRGVNTKISQDAQRVGIPVNVVDDPELCSFIVPSLVRRGDLLLAISTSGRSPALAKRIRRELEDQFGEEYAAFIGLLGSLRERVKSKYSTQREREAVFNKLIDCGILELLKEGRFEEAEARAVSCI